MNYFQRKWTLPFAFLGCLLLSGCLSYESFTMKVDFVSGTIECTYRNLTSNEVKLQGKEDSVESDWKSLKEMLKGDKEKKNRLVEIRSKLFEEDGVLSGVLSCRFAKADSSLEKRLSILNKQLDDNATLRLVEGMIVMLGKEGKEVLSTNGKIVNFSDKQIMITWPADTKTLELTLRGDSTKSLLPYYLKEQKKN